MSVSVCVGVGVCGGGGVCVCEMCLCVWVCLCLSPWTVWWFDGFPFWSFSFLFLSFLSLYSVLPYALELSCHCEWDIM